MTEVHAGLQQLRYSYLSHGDAPLYAVVIRVEGADPAGAAREGRCAGQGRLPAPRGSKRLKARG